MFRVLPLLAVLALLPSCAKTVPTPAPVSPAGTPAPDPNFATPAHDGEPQTTDEKLVAAHIRKHANDPASVQFISWGPNLGPAGIKYVFHDFDHKPETIGRNWVRAEYRTRNDRGAITVVDYHYTLFPDDHIEGSPTGNGRGSHWMEHHGILPDGSHTPRD